MDGTSFGRYRLVAPLGHGGMGEVWRAYDTGTDRNVAIKLLPPHFVDNQEFKQRFRREAQAAAKLNSPHVIPIYDYGEIEGRLYVCMRLVEGRDLQSVLADGPLSPARAVRIIEQVATALNAAHDVGLLHRDIKPSNILLDDNDFAYLIDFGIALAIGETRMTQSGYTIGTFEYIAPERLDSNAAENARADIYSLACVLYEALTGQPPFDGTTTAHLVAAHLTTPPPAPSASQPHLPKQFDEVIAVGMAKDPGHRYATTVELAVAARDAITAPIARPAPSLATPPAKEQAQLPATRATSNAVPAQPNTVKAPSPGPTKPTPARGRISRRTTIGLIAGVVTLVAVLVVVIGASALSKFDVLPFTGLEQPMGVAVDSSGNLYVADTHNDRVLKLPAGSSTQEVLPFTDLNWPAGVAVDTADNLYVTNIFNDRVLKLAAGSSTQEVLSLFGLKSNAGVAVDSAGNVYVANQDSDQVVKLTAGSSTQAVLPFADLRNPTGVAVDSTGTVYVADGEGQRVLKLATGSSSPTVLPFTGLKRTGGVAVDGADNLYVADNTNGRVLKLEAGSSTQEELPFSGSPFTGLEGPEGVAVDATGNIYVADQFKNRVLKLPVG